MVLPLEKLPTVLYVEDSAFDIQCLKIAFEEAGILCNYKVATNGEYALKLLRDKDEERPILILLDVDLPSMSGLEILSEIKADSSLRDIPTLMLTASSSDKVKLEARKRRADAFLEKPSGREDLQEVVCEIGNIWNNLIHYPDCLNNPPGDS